MIAYLPLTRSAARRLRGGAELALSGNAVTESLLAAHGLAAADDEDAQFTALGYAGLAALGVVDPESVSRLVVAIEVPPGRSTGENDLGTVHVQQVRWADVQALFADEPASEAAVEAARRIAGGRPLADLVDDTALVAGLGAVDLLWFDPSELDDLD